MVLPIRLSQVDQNGQWPFRIYVLLEMPVVIQCIEDALWGYCGD